MTPFDKAKARAVCAHYALIDVYEFYPAALARIEELEAALREALDWATPFDARHNSNPRGYASEVAPMFTRIGEKTRAEALAAIRQKAGEQ